MKAKLNSFLNFIFSRRVIHVVVVGFALLFFHGAVEALLNTTVVKFVLSHVAQSELNDTLFFVIAFGIVLFTLFKSSKIHIPKDQLEILTLSTIYYSLYRFNISDFNEWTFVGLSSFPFIKYADLLYLGLGAAIVFKICKAPYNENVSELYDDKPLHRDDEDLFEKDIYGYKHYAENVANRILNSQFDRSFAIGVIGRWGSGKTSFIHLVSRVLNPKNKRNSDVIEIWFSPWKSRTPEAIVNDFFNELEKGIENHHPTLGRAVRRYSEKLSRGNTTIIGNLIRFEFLRLDTLEELSNQVDKILERVDKKLIIYIDDLDRLDKNEVVEVLRLVRNTANFRNTFFIVPYDRNYVISAIEGINSHQKQSFLEKIFQIEIDLPFYVKNELERYFLEELSKFIDPEIFKENFVKDEFQEPNSRRLLIDQLIDSKRDVIRLLNSLRLNLRDVKNDVDLIDFIHIEMLRIKYPNVFELLKENQEEYLLAEHQIVNASNDLYSPLNLINDEENPTHDPKLFTEIRSRNTYYGVGNSENRLIRFLKDIFNPKQAFDILDLKQYKSLRNPKSYYHYFSYRVLSNTISVDEFERTMKLRNNDIFHQITAWIGKGFERDLRELYDVKLEFSSREIFESYIRGFFFFLTSKSKYGSKLVFDQWFMGQEAANKISNYGNSISSAYYNDKKEEYFKFISKLLGSAEYPFYVQSNIVYNLRVKSNSEYFIPEKDLVDLNVMYLKKFCQTEQGYSDTVWYLIEYCRNETGDVPDEAKEIAKTYFLEKALPEFLLRMIQPDVVDDTYALKTKVLFEYFEPDEIESSLVEIVKTKSTDAKYAKEFLNFFLRTKSTGYKGFVEFTFDVIPVHTLPEVQQRR